MQPGDEAPFATFVPLSPAVSPSSCWIIPISTGRAARLGFRPYPDPDGRAHPFGSALRGRAYCRLFIWGPGRIRRGLPINRRAPRRPVALLDTHVLGLKVPSSGRLTRNRDAAPGVWGTAADVASRLFIAAGLSEAVRAAIGPLAAF